MVNYTPSNIAGIAELIGSTFAIAEAIIDWIFMLRVYNLYNRPIIKYSWITLFVLLDAIPRIVAIAMYQTSTSATGLCLLSLPTTARIVKAALNTAFIGVVAVYFIYVMFGMISGAVGGVEVFESLTITSTAFGVILCIVRTVIYIPYILGTFGPVYTGTLIPIEMCLLPPLCFFSIAFGAKLKLRGSSERTKGTTLSAVKEKNSVPIPVQLNPVDARIQEYRKQKYLKIIIEDFPEICYTINQNVNMINNTLEIINETDLVENSDTGILYDTLREQYGVLLICKNKVDRWLALVTKTEDEDTARQQDILKKLIDTKMELGLLENVQNILDRVQIADESDDSNDFEDLDDYKPTETVQPTKAISPKKTHIYTMKSKGLEPVFKQRNSFVPIELEETTEEIVNPELKEYFDKAPVIEYGQDLEYWSQKPTFHQISSNAILQSHRFMGSSDDKELPQETIEQLTKRAVFLEPAPLPDIRECGARLKNGSTCKRKDLKKCPFHGPIIPRDKEGYALDPSQEIKKETIPEWKKAIEREIEAERPDPNTVRLSKKKDSKHNIRQVLKKRTSEPDMIEKYKRQDKSVFRW
ncbi:hypothetical protein HDV06_002034 [Boothiomyces sp. JEL0866]|nr:hypothetical protein HDV06_002034 [Boothiomyces sp. JEL0866]